MSKRTIQTELIAEQILNTLTQRKFETWYKEGAFDHWIYGELPKIDREDILDDIKRIFHLKDIDL